MNINYKQTQIELFPANSTSAQDASRPRFFLANLTLSIESLVILSILGIMMAVFSFALGVEHGKHLAADILDERISAAWNIKPKQAVVPVPVSAAGNAGFIRGSATAKPRAPAAAVVRHSSAKPAARTALLGKNITVKVATYTNESYAQKEALDLRAKGIQTFLIKSGKFWLVCAGRYPSQEAANVYLKKLSVQYRGSTIRRF